MRTISAFSAFLFDLDGTLVDDVSFHIDAWEEGFRAFGYRLGNEAIHAQIGRGAVPLIKELIGETEPAIIQGIRECHDLAFRKMVARIRPFPKAAELLSFLRARGIKTALVTSSQPQWVEELIEKSSFRFDVLVTSADVVATKPDPAPFLSALAKLKTEASRTLAVGDSPFDAIGACAAGIPCLGVLSGGFAKEDLLQAGVLAVYRDVAEILEKIDSLPSSDATIPE